MSSFGDIRAFFATPPAREHIWEELVVLLDSFTPREQLAEVVIPYCEDHLQQLDVGARPLSDIQLRRLLGGFELPVAGLITTISFRRERLRALQLGELQPREFERILSSHKWSALREVDLSGQHAVVALLDVLLESVYTENLVTLGLNRCSLGDQGLENLSSRTSLTRLRHLELRQAQLAERGVERMLEAAWFPRLERLVLGGNPSAERTLFLLSQAQEGGELAMRDLDLGGMHSDARIFTALMNSERLRSLERFDFSYSTIENRLLGDFVDSGMRLKELGLASCQVREGLLIALALAPQTRGLRRLDLSWNPLVYLTSLLLDEDVFPELETLWLSPSNANSAQRDEITCALKECGIEVRWQSSGRFS